MKLMHICIYNIFAHESAHPESYDVERAEKNQWGETGKAEFLRAIERLNAECIARNPQYMTDDGKAYDSGPWLVYADERPFDWDIVDHQPTDAEKASAFRAQRNGLLAASDWTQVPDCTLSTAEKAAWKTYRQALRDITAQDTFPESVTWPEAPNA